MVEINLVSVHVPCLGVELVRALTYGRRLSHYSRLCATQGAQGPMPNAEIQGGECCRTVRKMRFAKPLRKSPVFLPIAIARLTRQDSDWRG